jgi:hypothetical protein
MRQFPFPVLVCTAAVSFLSVACGGSVVGVQNEGGADGGTPTHDGGPSPDVVTVSDTGPGPDVIVGKDVSTGSETGMVSTTYPAPHPPMPQVISGGGPVVGSPVYVPITFPDDPNQTDIVAFNSGIGATTYFSAIVSQYGVGAATGGTPVILTTAQEPSGTGGTIADADIQTWLVGQIQSGALVGTDPSTDVYAIYFPAGTTITLPDPQVPGGTATSCSQFGGYHNSTSMSGQNVVYAVIPRCGSFETAGGQDLTGVAAITGPASHEYIEAVTDPLPETETPAYVEPDQNDIIFELVLGGGEVMDMCAQNPDAFYQPSDFAYTVQRGWSNSAALASHDPCEPELPGEVYFNSIGVFPNTLITAGGQSFSTDAVSLTVGSSKTVDVDLYSEAATSGPWTVEAVDAQSLGGGPAALSFSWDATSGENGQVLHLTITANSMPSQGIDGVIIVSELGTQASLWIGAVAVE